MAAPLHSARVVDDLTPSARLQHPERGVWASGDHTDRSLSQILMPRHGHTQAHATLNDSARPRASRCYPGRIGPAGRGGAPTAPRLRPRAEPAHT